MIVYVAGSSEELDRAERAMAMVRASGNEVANDWVREIRESGLVNRNVPKRDARFLSLGAIGHVQRASLLWVLLPETEAGRTSWGCPFEMGVFAGRLQGTIAVSGCDRERSIFLALADLQFEADDEIFPLLIRWGSRG